MLLDLVVNCGVGNSSYSIRFQEEGQSLHSHRVHGTLHLTRHLLNFTYFYLCVWESNCACVCVWMLFFLGVCACL